MSNTAGPISELRAALKGYDDTPNTLAARIRWADSVVQAARRVVAADLAAAQSGEDEDEKPEPCESGLPTCGPAVAWDSDGVGCCEKCARELGLIVKGNDK